MEIQQYRLFPLQKRLKLSRMAPRKFTTSLSHSPSSTLNALMGCFFTRPCPLTCGYRRSQKHSCEPDWSAAWGSCLLASLVLVSIESALLLQYPGSLSGSNAWFSNQLICSLLLLESSQILVTNLHNGERAKATRQRPLTL